MSLQQRARARRLRHRAEAPLRAEEAHEALAAEEVVPELEAFAGERPLDAFAPDWRDLWVLYSLVRERRPARVLELGAGCSTVALAAGLRANGAGHLWSVDAEQSWMASATESLPAGLQPFATISWSPLGWEELPDATGVYHAALPEIVPDFMYLDGPGRPAGWRPSSAGNIDPLRLEDRLRPGFLLVIDGRDRNAEYLRTHFRRRFRYVRQPGRHLFELLGCYGAAVYLAVTSL